MSYTTLFHHLEGFSLPQSYLSCSVEPRTQLTKENPRDFVLSVALKPDLTNIWFCCELNEGRRFEWKLSITLENGLHKVTIQNVRKFLEDPPANTTLLKPGPLTIRLAITDDLINIYFNGSFEYALKTVLPNIKIQIISVTGNESIVPTTIQFFTSSTEAIGSPYSSPPNWNTRNCSSPSKAISLFISGFISVCGAICSASA